MREARSARFLPALWTSVKGYTLETFGRDAIAGVTVGIVALPLAMAFGIAVGLDPIHGLVTGVVAGFLISFLGGSRYQIGGPTGAFVVIIANVIAREGYSGLVVATILAGVILIVLSLLRVGRLIEFVPYPVTTGFTFGIGVIIFTQQLSDFFGFAIASPSADFVLRIEQYVRAIHTIHPLSVVVGVVTIGGIVLVRRIAPRVPAAAASIAVVTLLVAILRIPVVTVADRFGEIPAALPGFRLPRFDLHMVRSVLPDSLSIALLAGIESLLSSLVADGMTGDRHRSDMELFAQGTANIASVLFGGIPATGAIARTATNIKAGARTPISGMIHSLTLLALIMIAAPLAGRVPLASLSAVLMVVAWDMAELHRFVRLLRSPLSDVAVLLATFLLTVIVDLTTAVQVGVVLSAFLFMRRMIQVSGVSAGIDEVARELRADVDGTSGLVDDTPELPPETEIYEIAGPFFFGVASRLPDILTAVEHPPRVVILRMRRVPAIDATGLQALETTIEGFRDRGTAVVLSGVQEQPAKAMVSMGITTIVGEANVCRTLPEAIDRARELVG